MNMNSLPSENIAIIGVIDPDALGVATVTTGWIAAKDFQSFMSIVSVGALGSSATVDAKLEQATDSSGTGAKDISGKAITQLTQAGTDSDKQVIINLAQAELDVSNDFDYFRLSMTVGTAISDGGAVVVGFNPRSGVASDSDLASVDEIVS